MSELPEDYDHSPQAITWLLPSTNSHYNLSVVLVTPVKTHSIHATSGIIV